MNEWFTKRRVLGIISGVALLVCVALIGSIVENVGADEIVVIQSVGGKLDWYSTPGPKLQLFGKVTRYKKRSIYEFEKQVRFNDGAHADMKASIQYEIPTDEKALNLIHKNFGSQEGVQNQLVATVVNKCVYMTGPTMSSQESYATKRNLLIEYVEDQVAHGVYRTQRIEKVEQDSISHADKKVSAIEILLDPKTGLPQRVEQPVLSRYGILSSNFSISDLKYDGTVEAQIAAQQKATMDVQLAIAEAKKADQRKLTTESEGAASAAKAKWEQETIRAKEVTKAQQLKDVAEMDAQQKLTVAELGAKTAEQYKKEQLLRADADAQYKKQVMQADGALAQKLDALVKINASWAGAFERYQGNIVPSVVMSGENNGKSGGTMANFMELVTAKTASDLSLQMSLPKAAN